MEHLPSNPKKTLLIEAHEPDGQTLGPCYAVVKLDHAFIEAVAQRAAILNKQSDGLKLAIDTADGDVCQIETNYAEVSLKFDAPTQSVLFEKETDSNDGQWELWRGSHASDAVLSFVANGGHVTTGICVPELVSRFAAQQQDAIEVFTRDDEFEFFIERLTDILDELNTHIPLDDETRAILEKVVETYEAGLADGDASNSVSTP